VRVFKHFLIGGAAITVRSFISLLLKYVLPDLFPNTSWSDPVPPPKISELFQKSFFGRCLELALKAVLESLGFYSSSLLLDRYLGMLRSISRGRSEEASIGISPSVSIPLAGLPRFRLCCSLIFWNIGFILNRTS
jgi:hypothetical protein